MIDLIFEFGGEVILIKIDNNIVLFGNTGFGNAMADISGLRLSYEGVIKEHPDLKERDDWKEEAIKRFKEKIKSFSSEREKANYIIGDLRKFGYKPKFLQRKGFRKELMQ